MSTFNIIDFYNSGAQVVVPASSVDMTHSFGATAGADGEDTQIGYEPKGNSKLASGASYDELDHDGQRYLLLKGGYVYDVKVGDSELHVISAESGHQSLPVPAGVEIEVGEHDPDAEPLPDVEDDDDDEAVDEQPESVEDDA